MGKAMEEDVEYNVEDLKDHDAPAAVIKDNTGRILMQEHVKYKLWTIPVGKAKTGQKVEEALKEEIYEECNIIIQEFKEIARRVYEYDRKGKKVKLVSYLYEITKYRGEIQNKEPEKHTKQEFKSIEEIKKISYLSDATILYLETLGYKRPARIR